MSMNNRILLLFLNYIPITFLVLFFYGLAYLPFEEIAFNYLFGITLQGVSERVIYALTVIYLVPPLITRLVLIIPYKKKEVYKLSDRYFYIWWATAQLQAVYMRFPFLEEILRLIPGVYSMWLRLWGAKIGSFVYWSPQVLILDRPFIKIGSKVIVGFGYSTTAHHMNLNDDLEFELIIAAPTVEDNAILGGRSSMGPGSLVTEGDLLPTHLKLAPFYKFSKGKKSKNL